MTLDELIEELQGEQRQHGDSEIGYEIGSNSIDILIGEDPGTGSAVTIKKPSW